MSPDEILSFWREAGPSRWFAKDAGFDAELAKRFIAHSEAALRGGLDHWATNWQGALALVILLDQFPRNLYRGQARAFSGDRQARAVAAPAIASGFDRRCEAELRQFFYLPFMHSENIADQDRSVRLCELTGDQNLTRFALEHRAIIRCFGRFPHRNAILGRNSRADEQSFLESGGFSG